MSSFTRTLFLTAAASLVLSGAPAVADESKARCAEAANSPLAEPEWYLEECLGGVRPEAPQPPEGATPMVPGDPTFLLDGRNGIFRTAPAGTLTYTVLGPNTNPIFCIDFDNTATTLYGINNTTRMLGTFNLTTGAFVPTIAVTGIPAGANISGLRFDPTDGTVYVSTTTQLFTLNILTGAATLRGSFTHATPAVIDIAISPTGQMYAEDITSDMFYSVNKTTGATTVIGPIGQNISFAQDMDFDNSDGILYAWLYIGGGVNNLSTYNLATGQATIQVPGTVDAENMGSVRVPSCAPPPAPTGVSATPTAPNQITVTWNAVAGASGYNVYRADGACPGTSYTRIGTNVAGTTYVDSPVSGGSTFAYIVRAIVSGCESLASTCDDALATGTCTLAPQFGGITSATSAGTPACAVNLAWSAGTPSCAGTTLKYNVYRSTTPGTPPSAATLIQSCLTTTTTTDNTAPSGVPHYYIVRAEDNTANGTGPCNSGIQDGNVIERSAVPGGPSVTATDDVESGNLYWNTAGGVGAVPWTIVTTQSQSPTHSWFVPDPASVSDQRMRTTSAGQVPAAFVMSFFHRYQTEESGTTGAWDGHVLEYSLDGGTTWTDILAAQGSVPANPARFLTNGYNRTVNVSGNPLSGRLAWSGNQLTFQEVTVDMADFAGLNVDVRFRFGSDASVADVGVWIDDIRFRFPGTCSVLPQQGAAPQALVADPAGNGVFQPNETIALRPTWRNAGLQAITLTGALANHTGPAGATYGIPDPAADYGTIAFGASASCTVTGNCYTVSNTMVTRPQVHWDSSVVETVTPTSTTKTWVLHIGDSFTDVPATSGFYRFIETIVHKNVTGGCGGTNYCPLNATSREQMAVFVLVSKEPAGYTPPACVAGSELFADVPATSPFCRWIEELADRGVVSGCGGGNYCPLNPATREQMAVFVLRTLDPTLVPPACVAGSEVFADVPASSPFCRFIEELVRRAVVSGCGGGNYCPTANVSREQMSVFLAQTFGLTLYGL